jgi:Zn-finger domain-containing protein
MNMKVLMNFGFHKRLGIFNRESVSISIVRISWSELENNINFLNCKKNIPVAESKNEFKSYPNNLICSINNFYFGVVAISQTVLEIDYC